MLLPIFPPFHHLFSHNSLLSFNKQLNSRILSFIWVSHHHTAMSYHFQRICKEYIKWCCRCINSCIDFYASSSWCVHKVQVWQNPNYLMGKNPCLDFLLYHHFFPPNNLISEYVLLGFSALKLSYTSCASGFIPTSAWKLWGPSWELSSGPSGAWTDSPSWNVWAAVWHWWVRLPVTVGSQQADSEEAQCSPFD